MALLGYNCAITSLAMMGVLTFIGVLTLNGLSDSVLTLMGMILLGYRGLIRKPRMRDPIIFLTSLVCGSSLVTLGPISGIDPLFASPLLAFIGILVVSTHYCSMHGFLLMCLLDGTVIGMGLVCTLWHSGVARLLPGFFAISCITCMALWLVILHFYTRGYQVTERVLNPILGSMLLSMGLAGLVPQIGAMKVHELMVSSPTVAPSAWKFLAMWCALCVAALPLQYWMMKDEVKPKMKDFGDLAARLVHPEAGTTKEDVQKKLESGELGGRHLILCDAMYAPEDADMSHLTEHEKKLVKICRNDEFERDRIMFLGGLA